MGASEKLFQDASFTAAAYAFAAEPLRRRGAFHVTTALAKFFKRILLVRSKAVQKVFDFLDSPTFLTSFRNCS